MRAGFPGLDTGHGRLGDFYGVIAPMDTLMCLLWTPRQDSLWIFKSGAQRSKVYHKTRSLDYRADRSCGLGMIDPVKTHPSRYLTKLRKLCIISER